MDELIYFGAQVKALGDGKVGGHLIRFSTDQDPDLTTDFFDATSEIQHPDTLPVLYQHGMDRKMGKRVIGKAKAGRDDIGVWVEAQLDLRDEYERAIYALAEKGKLGWSSGALSHLVEREPVGKAHRIKTWFVGEASLTPTPAEPRNGVMPLKALLTPEPADALTEPVEEGKPNVMKTMENKIMEDKDIKALVSDTVKQTLEGMSDHIETKASQIAEQKLEAFKSTLPEVKAGYHLEVVEDEADKAQKDPTAWGNAGEFFKAVKDVYANPWAGVDKRLKASFVDAEGNVKATGMSEAIPSEGGFLVPQSVAAGLIEKMYNTGQILSRVNIDPVQGNNMTFNLVDETSRVNGSRNGGIQAYWAAEGGSLTASKPKFSQADLKLQKVYALVYGTDEQLEDVGFMSSWLGRVVPDELRFKVEDAFVEGDGVGKPQGFMNSDALVSVTRENANNITYNDIINMWARRYAGVSDYVWLIHQDVNPELDSLYLGDGSTGIIPPRFVDYDAQGAMRMKGRPVIEVEYAQTLGTSGDIALVSWSQYAAIQKASGIQTAASIHVAFTTGEQAFRFTYRVAGQSLWKSALTPFHGSNTVSPFIVLSATS